MNPSIPVFVIAFRDAKRRAAITKRLAPLGIKPRFMDAVDGRKLTAEQRKPFADAGREYHDAQPFRAGAMGCALSHFAVWRKIRDEKIPAAMVLEDDATPTADATPAIFTAALALLQKYRSRLDVVFLSDRFDRPLIRVDAGDGEAARPALALRRYCDIGSESYFITRASAAYLLSRRDLRYRHLLDILLHQWWLHGEKHAPLYLVPPLFMEEGRPSQIGYAEKIRHPHDRLHYELIRRLRRARNSARKRMQFPAHVARIKRRLRGKP